MTATAQPTQDGTFESPDKAKTYEVNIEGTIHPWNERTITPAEIRTLGGLPANEAVIEIDFKDNTETTLAEGVPVELKAGQGFGKKVGFKRGNR